jgi:hypothetical protein
MVLVVVLVVVVTGRYLHDRRAGEFDRKGGESTLEGLTRRHKVAMAYLSAVVAIALLLFFIATAHVPCSRRTRPSNPIACK